MVEKEAVFKNLPLEQQTIKQILIIDVFLHLLLEGTADDLPEVDLADDFN